MNGRGGAGIERTNGSPPARFEFERPFFAYGRRMSGARRSNPWLRPPPRRLHPTVTPLYPVRGRRMAVLRQVLRKDG